QSMQGFLGCLRFIIRMTLLPKELQKELHLEQRLRRSTKTKDWPPKWRKPFPLQPPSANGLLRNLWTGRPEQCRLDYTIYAPRRFGGSQLLTRWSVPLYSL